MDALRTAVVLVLLLALGYGVWVVLNHDSGVEEPPSFEWDTEVADGGVSGFGDGPFVPPAGETLATPDESAFAFGAASTGAPETAADAASAMSPPTGYGATAGGESPASPAMSRFVAEPQATGSGDPGLPPPPPGFANGADSGPATDIASAETTGADAEPPAPPTDTAAASRYGGASEIGGASPLSGDSRYGTAPEPAAPAAQETVAIPKSSPVAPAPAASAATSLAPAPTIEETLAAAKKLSDEGEAYEALYLLSQRYGDPALSADDLRSLHAMLDPLAGRVIYSTEHLLEEPYVARRGDSLKVIAQEMKVPYQLLQNINAVENPEVLTPGAELKVVRGPFRAEINLAGNELTLFLGPLYAGRFPVSLGVEPSPSPGEYTVRSKEQGKAYFGANGASFPADHPSNPYGRYWIDLGNQMCIHGTPAAGENPGLGCVSLSPVDAADVYGILSAGSKVRIRR